MFIFESNEVLHHFHEYLDSWPSSMTRGHSNSVFSFYLGSDSMKSFDITDSKQSMKPNDVTMIAPPDPALVYSNSRAKQGHQSSAEQQFFDPKEFGMDSIESRNGKGSSEQLNQYTQKPSILIWEWWKHRCIRREGLQQYFWQPRTLDSWANFVQPHSFFSFFPYAYDANPLNAPLVSKSVLGVVICAWILTGVREILTGTVTFIWFGRHWSEVLKWLWRHFTEFGKIHR